MFGSLKGQVTGAAGEAAGKSMQDPSKRYVIYYCILSLLTGFGVGFAGFIARNNPEQAYLLSACSYLVVGVLHVWVMYRIFKWAGKGNLLTEMGFTFLILVLMVIGMSICYFIFNREFLFSFFTTLISFVVPLLIHWSANYAISIPPKEFKKWFYPDTPIVTDMENMDLSNFAVITFIFSKKEGDATKSNFQSKAPYAIRLGDLFYFFLQEWNHKNPGSTIQYSDETNAPYGWHFYIKKSWWKPREYLDADYTIRENKIGVNQMIITQRIKN